MPLRSQVRGVGLVVVRDGKVVGLHCSASEVHAGQAAIIQHGNALAGCQLYFSRRPCATCLKMLINGENRGSHWRLWWDLPIIMLVCRLLCTLQLASAWFLSGPETLRWASWGPPLQTPTIHLMMSWRRTHLTPWRQRYWSPTVALTSACCWSPLFQASLSLYRRHLESPISWRRWFLMSGDWMSSTTGTAAFIVCCFISMCVHICNQENFLCFLWLQESG